MEDYSFDEFDNISEDIEKSAEVPSDSMLKLGLGVSLVSVSLKKASNLVTRVGVNLDEEHLFETSMATPIA
jgi:hypothetical protein